MGNCEVRRVARELKCDVEDRLPICFALLCSRSKSYQNGSGKQRRNG